MKNFKGIEGKSAIVTGGTSGIGYATAERLVEEGCLDIIISGRNPEKGERALAQFKKDHPEANVHLFIGDMSKEQTCIDLMAMGIKLFGKVDFLVNNAFAFTRYAWTATRENWMNVMRGGVINYATMISQYKLQHPDDHKGAIVNVSSISAHIAQPRSWTYNSAKGAVDMLTKQAGVDLAPNIRVNSISPAGVFSDETVKNSMARGAKDAEEIKNQPQPTHLMGRMIMPEECAGPIVFLLSDEASSISATDLPVDMGYMAVGAGGFPRADMGDLLCRSTD